MIEGRRIVLLLLPLSLWADQIINTVAGGYLPPAGGAAASAQLLAGAITADGAGNFYFIAQNRIYKVDITGRLTVIAGTGASGRRGDGGQAINSKIANPNGIALDSLGNLYLNDSEGIRKINLASGAINLFATGAGAGSMVFDRSGKLFVSDTNLFGASVVNQVDVLTASVTRLAGNGESGHGGNGGLALNAQLSGVAGITSDGIYVYILDGPTCPNCFRPVRQVNLKTGIITDWPAAASFFSIAAIAADAAGTVYVEDGNAIYKVPFGATAGTRIAGTGVSGFSGDGGQAKLATIGTIASLAADGSRLYFTDGQGLGASRIRQVTLSSGIINTVAGAPPSGLIGDGGPALNSFLGAVQALAVDSAGNYFIADSVLNNVRRVDAVSGNITTFAGTGTPGYSGDGGQATSASLNQPTGLALDKAGNLYIADRQNNCVRMVDLTGKIRTVAGTGTAGFSGDGGPATNAQLNLPSLVAIEPSGNLVLADDLNYRVRRLTVASGVIGTVAGNGTSTDTGNGGSALSASLSTLLGLAVDSGGNIYISTLAGIRKVTLSSGIISSLDSFTFSSYLAHALATDGANSLYYLATIGNASVFRYDFASSTASVVAGLDNPEGMAMAE